MMIRKVSLFFVCLFILSLFASLNVAIARAETTPYRSAGWVSTDGSPAYSNTTGCQASNDGLYCSRPLTNSNARLYFSSFGTLADFGIPPGSYINKLHIRVRGKNTVNQTIAVTSEKNKIPLSFACQLPSDLWQVNLGISDSVKEYHTFISSNGLTNCITAENINFEKVTFSLQYSSASNWSADIDNFEIAFDYSNPTYAWQNKGFLNKPRYAHTATLLDNGKILIVGGEASGLGVRQVEMYDPTTGVWSLVSLPSVTRRFHTADLVTLGTGNKSVLVVGGHELFGSGYQNTAELYNTTSNTWTLTPNLSYKRAFHASSMLNDGRLLITGGANDFGVLNSTEIYDPIANVWTVGAPLNTARRYHSQISFTNSQGVKKVMVIGGIGSTGDFLKSTEIYDPVTDAWTAGPNMNFARYAHQAIVLHDGRILVAGTDYPNDTTSEVYDPATNSWTVYTTAYPFRGSGKLALLSSEAGYKVLGVGGNSTLSNDAQLFDPDTNTWTRTDSMNAPRNGFTLTRLQDGTVLAASGNGALGQIPTTEVYTPFLVTPTSSPTVAPTATPTPTAIPSSTPTPSPTSIPTPTPAVLGDATVAPFLNLPFDYQSIGKKFEQVALDPESWFDHEYPLADVLCTGVFCPLDILKFNSRGERTLDGYRHHNGYDYSSFRDGASYGMPVLAAADGVSIYIPENLSGGYGNLVKITHPQGYQTWYGHLQPQANPISGNVEKGQPIGLVGMSGNATGAHIHFTVLKDINNNHNFDDDIPYGFVDPLGWEGKGQDPWTQYGNTIHGAQSYNLFTDYLQPLPATVPPSGSTVDAGNVKITVPPGAAVQFFTLSVRNSSFEKKDKHIVSAAPSFFLTAVNTVGDFITQFLAPITITYDYSDADLANIVENTMQLYWFNEATKTWEVLPSSLDKENKTVTAQTSHFSQFALMGEIKDAFAPQTTAVIHGEQGENGWYHSPVNGELIAQDNEGGLDVLYTLYKVNEDEWTPYTDPIVLTEEGEYTLTYQSADYGDNLEEQNETSFTIDMTQPTTDMHIVSGTEGAEGWYTSDVTFSLQAQDALSGVAKTEYSLDDGLTYKEYQNNVVVSSEGENHIFYRSRDKAGNVEEVKSIVLKIDKTASHSLVYTTGILGAENWYRSDVQVSLNAADDFSGYKTSYYSFNDDENYTEYTDPLVIAGEGITKVNYYSMDNAGNVEERKHIEIKIDKTVPEAKIKYDLEKKDLVITGIDDQGTPMVTETQIEKNKQRVTIKDKAGNTLVLDGVEREHGDKAVIKLFSLSYNGSISALDENNFTTHYDVDKNGAIKTLKQVYKVREEEKVRLEYNAKEDKTTIMQKREKIEVPGLKFLQLTTHDGEVKYSYD